MKKRGHFPKERGRFPFISKAGKPPWENGKRPLFLRFRDFGEGALVWAIVRGVPRIRRVVLARPGCSAREQIRKYYPGSSAGSCSAIETAIRSIQAVLQGKPGAFSLDMLDWQLCSRFQQSVLRAASRIPRGKVSTYQLLAEYVSCPRAARAAGAALAANPFPLLVACHRIVCSNGALGGYQAGPAVKRALLIREGVAFDRANRIICKQYYSFPVMRFQRRRSNG